jgi:tetratricopeptide (TPR) repeat protein
MKSQIKNKKSHKRSNSKNSINSYINLLYRKIYLFEERGEYEEAILLYDKILEMYPNDQDALLWKNNLINLQGKQERMYS